MVSVLRRAVDGVHRLFNHPRLRAWFLGFRVPLSVGALIGLLAMGQRAWFWPGLAISIVGVTLQLWCFACIHTRRVLATEGPYAVVRNPMYLARYLALAGMVLWSGRWELWIAFSVLYYFYMVNRVRREESQLRDLFGASYLQYCVAVPRFLPRFRKGMWPTLIRGVRAENFRRQHGLRNALAMVAVYLLAYWVIMRLRSPGG